MRKLAILDDYMHVALECADWSVLKGRCDIDVIDHNLAVPDEAAARLAPYEILCTLRERMPFPRSLVERLPNLRLVAGTGTNYWTMDWPAVTERGVLVARSIPGSGTGDGFHTTSEMTWALVLATARQIPLQDRSLRRGGWQAAIGSMLYGKTLGILGLGKVGSRVASFGRAFGMNVIAWSPNMTEESAAKSGAKRVDKDELFRQSDFLSLHVVLSDRSRGIVGARELGLMKSSAILINTARGALVDEDALLEALRTKRIAGAGLDVFVQEPLRADHPLCSLENTVLTPHLGYSTFEVFQGMYQSTVENVVAYLDGKPIRIVNPEAMDHR